MGAHIGRRLRKGATSGVVMAAAVAALAASQAPEATPPATDNTSGDQAIGAGDTTSPSGHGSVTGDSPYYTDLPPLNPPNLPGASTKLPLTAGPAEAGIPASVYSAYKRAELSIRSTDPGCNLPWQLLAGIGKVESGQANGGRVDANGTASPRILGPALDGNGFALITDTDGGAYDGDTKLDRAVGPMQFIPSTWATWGQDANSDGKKDPNNIYDAAQAAGLYLCANDRNLALKADLDQAILSYNRSREYLNTVLSWVAFYERGTHQIPDGTGVLPVGRSDNGSRGGRPRPATSLPTVPTAPTPGTQKPKPPAENRPGTAKPPTVPTEPPVTPPVTPPALPAVARVARLMIVANEKPTATTGSAFTGLPRVAALDASGKPVPGVNIRFEIIGATDTRFGAGGTTATVTTGSAGLATSPALRAGEKTGAFTVRATVVGRTLGAADFAATVTERQADTLTRLAGDPLAATTGTSFTQKVQVKATDKGALAPGVRVTAVIVTSKTDTAESADGPSFKRADGTTARTVTLVAGTDGLLTLEPGDLLAGDKAGTYYVRLTAPGGGTAFIDLTVNAPATTNPDPTPTPSPTPSGGTPSETTTPSPGTSPSA
ncbi:lytic transglycosylase [Streptomyces litmocidini]|uniref:lytic transglycosylase domain-containing protein n=1 Tax=Streptomyces litmocidini TaxID=67318 RepID=UPI00167E2952|nr:lytic transglycosylase domain-containing protein [Streptomyces litmocidini]GGU89087.1 lytic transglycosylase [Streptomyces litmocidini]